MCHICLPILKILFNIFARHTPLLSIYISQRKVSDMDTIDVNILIQALKSQCVLYYKFTDGNGQDTIIPCDVNDNTMDAEGTIHSEARLNVHHIRTSLGEGKFMPGSQYKLTLWRIPPTSGTAEAEIHIINCDHVNLQVDACQIANASLVTMPGSMATSSIAPGLPAVVSVVIPGGINKILYSSVIPSPSPKPPTPQRNYTGLIILGLILLAFLIYYNNANKAKSTTSARKLW
jgi:hypothetical protein